MAKPPSPARTPSGAANPEVDWYFEKNARWEKEIRKLRAIVLGCALTEELKWGCPCYTLDGRNVVLIHVFKDYCALLFFKGALLKNGNGRLVRQTQNVQSARQIRFTSVRDVAETQGIASDCIREAIAVERAGLKVARKTTGEFAMPDEFAEKLRKMPAVKKAFEALTPGRQRAYLLHFSAAKRSVTRAARVEKCLPAILDGKGLDD